MNRRSFIRSSGAVATGASVGVAGCLSAFGGGGGSSGEDFSTKAQFSLYPVIVHGLPLLVGTEKGFFQDNGVEISKITSGPGGGDSVRPLTTGEVGFGMSGPNAVTKAYLAGAPIYWAGLATAVPEVTFQTRPDSDIEEIQDLKGGGKIAVTRPGSSTEANAFLSVRNAEGISMDDVELVYAGGLGEAVAAMKEGVADVTMNTRPTSVQMINNGEARRVWRTSDYVPDFTEDVLAMGDILINKEPETAKRIVQGWIDSIEWLKDNVEESAKMWADANDRSDQYDLYIEALEDARPEDLFRIKIREKIVENTEAVMKFQGALGEDESLPPEVVDQSALPDEYKNDNL